MRDAGAPAARIRCLQVSQLRRRLPTIEMGVRSRHCRARRRAQPRCRAPGRDAGRRIGAARRAPEDESFLLRPMPSSADTAVAGGLFERRAADAQDAVEARDLRCTLYRCSRVRDRRNSPSSAWCLDSAGIDSSPIFAAVLADAWQRRRSSTGGWRPSMSRERRSLALRYARIPKGFSRVSGDRQSARTRAWRDYPGAGG